MRYDVVAVNILLGLVSGVGAGLLLGVGAVKSVVIVFLAAFGGANLSTAIRYFQSAADGR